jgi:hypothetical protein
VHIRYTATQTHLPAGESKDLQIAAFLKRLMGFEPTTFCMASRAWEAGVYHNVPANGVFLSRVRAESGVWDFAAIYGSLRTD